MKQLFIDTQNSSTAITFVDALSILRAIRSKGQNCMQYQAELLLLLEHPQITRKAQAIIENSLGGELKEAARQRERANRTITAKDQGKSVRVAPGDIIEVEFKSQAGFYWEVQQPYTGIDVQRVLGEGAKAGHERFRCTLSIKTTQTLRFELRQDARFSKKHSLRTPSSTEFHFTLKVEH